MGIGLLLERKLSARGRSFKVGVVLQQGLLFNYCQLYYLLTKYLIFSPKSTYLGVSIVWTNFPFTPLLDAHFSWDLMSKQSPDYSRSWYWVCLLDFSWCKVQVDFSEWGQDPLRNYYVISSKQILNKLPHSLHYFLFCIWFFLENKNKKNHLILSSIIEGSCQRQCEVL